MSGNCRSSHTVASIYPFTKVHRFVCRIIMIGQHTRSAGYTHVIDTVIMQHFFSHILSCHTDWGEKLYVDTQDVWDLGDHVAITIPQENISFE